MRDDSLPSDAEEQDSTRELRVVFAGSHRLGLFADEIEAIADWRTPTPLPQAPQVVLGIACIRGRMLTVLDIAALLGDATRGPAAIVVLRGDEQLALAVDRVGETIEIATDEARSAGNDERGVILGVVNCGNEEIAVLNVAELFASAIRGRERRRRRF